MTEIERARGLQRLTRPLLFREKVPALIKPPVEEAREKALQLARLFPEIHDPIAASDVNVLLIDLSLPDVDGFTAAKRIREDPQMRDVPIVAVTAHVEQQYRTNALGAGMTAFVTKPVDIDFLNDLLASVVGGE